MIFQCIPMGMFGSNCYVVGSEGEGIIVDAGVDAGEVMSVVEKKGLTIKYIVLTHTHIDHICCLEDLRAQTGAKVLVHEEDAGGLSDEVYNGSALFGTGMTFRDAERILKDGDVFTAGGSEFEIIHTPGHTRGSICIKTGKLLFTGDTLFRNSIGRTDLEGGSREDLDSSIMNRLMKLDDDMQVHPGHGMFSTIGYERAHNPFILL